MAPDRFAFVTLVTSDSYAKGAQVVAAALRELHPTPPSPPEVPFETVCIVTPETVDVSSIKALRSAFDVVIGVEVIEEDQAAGLRLLGRPDLHLVLTKLHVFRLTQYFKIIFLDADTLPIRPLSHLFTVPHEFSAVPDVGWPDIFNSGMMVLTPGEDKFQNIMGLVKSRGSWDGGDQGVLNEWRGSDWNRLSFTYNTTPTAAYTYAPAYERFGSKISLIHFIGSNKPWASAAWRPPFAHVASSSSSSTSVSTSSPPVTQKSYAYDKLVDRWFDVYDHHVRDDPVVQAGPSFQPKRFENAWSDDAPTAAAYAAPVRFDLDELKRMAIEGSRHTAAKPVIQSSDPGGAYLTLPLEGRVDLMRPPKPPQPRDETRSESVHHHHQPGHQTHHEQQPFHHTEGQHQHHQPHYQHESSPRAHEQAEHRPWEQNVQRDHAQHDSGGSSWSPAPSWAPPPHQPESQHHQHHHEPQQHSEHESSWHQPQASTGSSEPYRPPSPPLINWNPAVEPPPTTFVANISNQSIGERFRNVWDMPVHQQQHYHHPEPQSPPRQQQQQQHHSQQQQHHQEHQQWYQPQPQQHHQRQHWQQPEQPEHHDLQHHHTHDQQHHSHQQHEPYPYPRHQQHQQHQQHYPHYQPQQHDSHQHQASGHHEPQPSSYHHPGPSPPVPYRAPSPRPDAFFPEPPVQPPIPARVAHEYAAVASHAPNYSKVSSVFPWEQTPRSQPSRVFPTGDQPPPAIAFRTSHRKQPEPPTTPGGTATAPVLALQEATPPGPAGAESAPPPGPGPQGAASSYKDVVVEESPAIVAARSRYQPGEREQGSLVYSNAWDSVPSINRYASRLVRPPSRGADQQKQQTGSPRSGAGSPTSNRSGKRGSTASKKESDAEDGHEGDDEDDASGDEGPETPRGGVTSGSPPAPPSSKKKGGSSNAASRRGSLASIAPAGRVYNSQGVQTIQPVMKHAGVQVEILTLKTTVSPQPQPAPVPAPKIITATNRARVGSGSSSSPPSGRSRSGTAVDKKSFTYSPRGPLSPRMDDFASPQQPRTFPHQGTSTPPQSFQASTAYSPAVPHLDSPISLASPVRNAQFAGGAPATPQSPLSPSASTIVGTVASSPVTSHLRDRSTLSASASDPLARQSWMSTASSNATIVDAGLSGSPLTAVSPELPQPRVVTASRKWDPATGVDVFKRDSQEVLARFLRAGGFGSPENPSTSPRDGFAPAGGPAGGPPPPMTRSM